MAFLEIKENICPTDDDYICYFHHLHKTKGVQRDIRVSNLDK